jgi:hypothetical protein
MSSKWWVRASLAKLLLGATLAMATSYPIGQTPTPIVTAGSMAAASITSDWIPITGIDNINVQCAWTGTPTGTFDVQVSLDASTPTSLVINPALTAAGSASNFDLDLNQQGAAYFRVIYTRTGSTGTLNCTAYGKKI